MSLWHNSLESFGLFKRFATLRNFLKSVVIARCLGCEGATFFWTRCSLKTVGFLISYDKIYYIQYIVFMSDQL